MTLYDYYDRQIPDYYPTMHMDGYTPEQIRHALNRKMICEYEESQTVDEIRITSEVKRK